MSERKAGMVDSGIVSGPVVTMEQMLAEREARVERRKRLLNEARENECVVFLTMNVPGTIKRFLLADRSFAEADRMINLMFGSDEIRIRHRHSSDCGCEAGYLIRMNAESAKRRMIELEETHPLGRLMDSDVFCPDGRKISRHDLGLPARTCLLCERDAHDCARSHRHGEGAVLEETVRRMRVFDRSKFSEDISTLAAKALLSEAATTPKPGLVDLLDSGAHRDMDFFLFIDSSLALQQWFRDCALFGYDHHQEKPEEIFHGIQQMGLIAERRMFSVTGGVNTHKGLLFSLGIIVTAAAILYAEQENPKEEDLFRLSAELGKASLAGLAASGSGLTHGQSAFLRHGITGARGEAAGGFRTVSEIALPVLRQSFAAGMNQNDAYLNTLLHLIKHVEDTNVIARTGKEGLAEAKRRVHLAESENRGLKEKGRELNRLFTERNISPGGSADLLAVAIFVHLFLEKYSLKKIGQIQSVRK